LAPALVVVVPVFVVAVGLALAQSFGVFPPTGRSRFNLDAYRSLLSGQELWRSLAFTSYISFTSTTLAVGLGVAVALAFRRVFSGSRVWTFLLQLSLPVPHLVGALAMILLLGQSGLLARVADTGGLIDGPASFPALVFDSRGVAIIAEFVWKEVPFFALIALGALGSVADDHEVVAASLGAGPLKRFRYVIVPLLAPVMLPASVVVFAFTFGTFEVPLLLGGSSLEALPVLAYRRFTSVDLAARPEAMAAGVIMMVIITVAALIYLRLGRRHAGRQ
jgi:putative spermidine/putrescine transport system permease protein